MNTNQPTDTNSTFTAPFSSAIIQNFFDETHNNQKEKTREFSSRPNENGEIDVSHILSRLENKKEVAAVNLAIGVDEVETIPFDLSALETEGIFLNIDASGFGALTRQLDWKTLGVELPEHAAVHVSPPRAGLLPDIYRRKLMRGAAQAHNALNRYGFRFTLCETIWGTSEYKWIPWSAFEQFEQEYKKACETLANAKAEVLENYDDILPVMKESFTDIAKDSAKRLEATLDAPFDSDEFVFTVVSGAYSMIPTREMIRDGLSITLKPKVIVLGSEMIAEQNRSRELNLETERLDIESRAIRLELDTRTQIEQQKVTDFEQDQRREHEVKERIRQMKIEAAKDAANEAISPIKEGFDQITSKIFEAAQEMAGKLQNSEFVPGALAKRARQMCEWYQLMNFTNDSSLEEVLNNLQTAAGRDSKVRSTEEMRSALGDVMRATTIQSKRLLDEDRLSALEI